MGRVNCSIDVSNGNSHYMCFIKNNKRFGKVKKIDHDIEGFKRLPRRYSEAGS
ncbi:MAG: hypothetical protein ACLTTH_10880 [Holdemanella porci]